MLPRVHRGVIAAPRDRGGYDNRQNGVMPSTIRALREHAIAELAAAGVPDPAVDAELLLGHVLGIGRGEVQAKIATDAGLANEHEVAFRGLVVRRAAREPLQHLTGRAPFRSLELAVGPGVFIPRPETETVAQLAIDALRAAAEPEPVAVDLGTGSGAIALALASEVPHARVFAVERSAEAYAWAERNVAEFGLDNLTLVLGDLDGAFPDLEGRAAVVVSNPPYIPADAVPRDPEVRLFDPAEALYGGEDGLDVVHVVSATGLRLLHAGGTLVIEHGESQGADIRGLLAAAGWRAPATHPDLLGRDRATTALR
jgi:release factor glutamine methyltransferase